MPSASTPGMSDGAIIALVIITLIVGALVAAIFSKGRAQVIGYDLKTLKRKDELTPAWIGGTIVAIALIGVTSFTAQRDEAMRHPNPADQRLAQLIARTHCPAPADSLEVVVMSIGMQSDGKRPSIQCVYLTSPLGQRPIERRAPPTIYAEAAQ